MTINTQETPGTVERGKEMALTQGSNAAEEIGLFGIWGDNDATVDVESFLDELRRSRCWPESHCSSG